MKVSLSDHVTIWLSSVNPFLHKFCPKVAHPLLIWASETFDANCGRMVRDSAMVTTESLQGRPKNGATLFYDDNSGGIERILTILDLLSPYIRPVYGLFGGGMALFSGVSKVCSQTTVAIWNTMCSKCLPERLERVVYTRRADTNLIITVLADHQCDTMTIRVLWVQKIPSKVWHFFHKRFRIFDQLTYYTFLSTPDDKFLFTYLQIWQSYAILNATTLFT